MARKKKTDVSESVADNKKSKKANETKPIVKPKKYVFSLYRFFRNDDLSWSKELYGRYETYDDMEINQAHLNEHRTDTDFYVFDMTEKD